METAVAERPVVVPWYERTWLVGGGWSVATCAAATAAGWYVAVGTKWQCLSEEHRAFGFLPSRVRRLWSETDSYADEVPDSSFDVDLEFRVPADAPGTDLAAEPSVFWELEVVGDGAGFRYHERFRLPVYSVEA